MTVPWKLRGVSLADESEGQLFPLNYVRKQKTPVLRKRELFSGGIRTPH